MGVFTQLINLMWRFNGRNDKQIATEQIQWNSCSQISNCLKESYKYAKDNGITDIEDFEILTDWISSAFPELEKSRPLMLGK